MRAQCRITTYVREMWLAVVLAVAVVVPQVPAVQNGWRPIPGPGPSRSSLRPSHSHSHGPRGLALSLPPLPPLPTFPSHSALAAHHHHHEHPNMCVLYKAVLDQDTFPQYVQYKTQIPDMKEFTLCLWHKFYNHSQDQPLFSYAHRDKPRVIYSWVANTDSSSYYMMAINGQTMYRLNYPVRRHKWYHMCQSWNGKTGEWQIWVNGERIGRGFHNLLVGKPIKGGGMAVTGQEQLKSRSNSRKQSGLLGEVTLVNLYKAALTAGKAYTNHKHHHVHHFHHEEKAGEDDYDINPSGATTPAPAAPPMPPAQGTMFPFLSNGQLIPMLPISELTAIRGPDGSKSVNLFSPYNSQVDLLFPSSPRVLFKRDQAKHMSVVGKRTKKSEKSTSADTEELDADILKLTPKETKKVKRETLKLELDNKNEHLEEDIAKEAEEEEKTSDVQKRQTSEAGNDEKNQKKRTVFDEQFQFGLIPGDDLSGLFPGDGYILGGGGVKFDSEERGKPPPEMVQMEPAEWEVRSIMAVCSGCSEDPFRKASIISWRESPKKLFAGAKYVPAVPECQRF